MADNKTIELYRLLKKSEPNGDFSAYEKRIKEYLGDCLTGFIRSFKLSADEIKSTVFLKSQESNVLALAREIEEYKSALSELISLCRECIKTGVDISGLQTAGFFIDGKLNLSSASAVKNVISVLNTAKGVKGGRYLTKNPLEILFNPVTYNNRSKYERGFLDTLNEYISAEVVRESDVIEYLTYSGCTFVSQSFLNTLLNEANAKLTGKIHKETKRNRHRVARSIYIPVFILLAVFTAPMLTLAALGIHIKDISGYWWILVAGVGLICGFLPVLLSCLLREKLQAYYQLGSKAVKMVAAPLAVACIYLAIIFGLSSYLLLRNNSDAVYAVIAFSAIYFIFYVVAVCVCNYNYSNGMENDDNSTGLQQTFFWLIKVLLPFCVSILFADNLGAYLTFNLMAIATCIIYEIAYAADEAIVSSSFVTLGLSACFALFITSLLALCRVEGLYIFYLILFDLNSTAMYAVSIIFFEILFVIGIPLALYFYYECVDYGDTLGWLITFVVIMLAISIIVYGVGFAKLKKLNKSSNATVVGNSVLIIESGNLKSVYGSTQDLEIPSSVTKISSGVFQKSSSAKNITVPSSVKTIDAGAFKDCKNLQSISLPFVGSDLNATYSQYFGYIFGKDSYKGSIEVDGYYFPSKLKSVTVRGGKVGDGAFKGCSFLTEITLGSSVVSIGKNVFYGCSNLNSLTLPYVGRTKSESYADTTTLLGYMFSKSAVKDFSEVAQTYNGSNKTTYYIPASLQNLKVLGGKIFYGAFSNCTMLKNVTLGEDVTKIESSAFTGCSSLESLTLPFVGSGKNAGGQNGFFGYIFGSTKYNGGIETEQKTFNDSQSTNYGGKYYIPSTLKNVTLSDGVIASGAFSNCANLESIVFPKEIKRIGCQAFYGCKKLLKTADGVQYVNDWVVGCEKSVKAAVIANKTVGIANYTFDGAADLKSVTVPESLLYIGVNAFRDCNNLEDTTYLGTLEKWSLIDFADENSSPIKKNFYIDKNLVTSLEVPQEVKVVPRYVFRNILSLKSLTIPETVTGMEDRAFSGCTYLTEINYNTASCNDLTENSEIFAYGGQKSTGITVNVGSKVKAVPQYLFYTKDEDEAPNIISLKFNEKSACTSIESYAFANCPSLKEVTIPESVSTICTYAFADCTQLIKCENGIYYAGNWVIGYDEGITDAAIRNDTYGIADEAFKDCATLTKIIIPASVKKIGKDAFVNCSALQEVNLPFTAESYGIDNFRTCPNFKKFVCNNGTFVKFVIFYDKDGTVYSQKLLTAEQTISSSQLAENTAKEGYLFGGWYTDKYLDMSKIKTSITASDTGFIDLYPCYMERSEVRTIRSGTKTIGKSVSNEFNNYNASFNVSRMYQLRSYGYYFNFTLSYSTSSYDTVTISTSHGHTTNYTASCSSVFTLSYTGWDGTVYNSKTGPSVSAKLGSNWLSGGSASGKASSLLNVNYSVAPILGYSITLEASYCYNTGLGDYGKATFDNADVRVYVYYAQA